MCHSTPGTQGPTLPPSLLRRVFCARQVCPVGTVLVEVDLHSPLRAKEHLRGFKLTVPDSKDEKQGGFRQDGAFDGAAMRHVLV